MKVAVVILNWNGKKFLDQFLPSVIKNNPSFSKVVVADNASTDDSVAFLKSNYPSVEIIQNKVNGGYAKGYNDALKHIDAEYYILLNSDVEVTPNWIDEVINVMDTDKSIAACQPKIKDYNNKTFFEYAGACGGYIDKFGFPFCRGRLFDVNEQDNGQYDTIQEVFWATGACLFIRAELYHKMGGLDEDFFAHMEEIDLCWRLKNVGYKIMVNPNSMVYHVGGGTLNKTNPRKTYLNFRNNLFLIFKNHSSKYFLIKLFIRAVFDGVAALKFLFGGQFNHHLAVWKAHFSFYGSLGILIKKRKKLKTEIKNYATSGVYDKNVVLDFYWRGKKKFSEIESNKILS